MNEAYQERFRSFFDQHYGLIYRNFLTRTGNQAEAEDLTQDTFLRAAKGFHGVNQELTVAWLVTIAGNVFKNWIRYHQASKREGREKQFEEGGLFEAKMSQCQEKSLMVKQEFSALQEAIHALPPQMKRCFTMYYLQEYKYHEIAALLEINIQTVKSQLNKARKKVGEALEEHQRLS